MFLYFRPSWHSGRMYKSGCLILSVFLLLAFSDRGIAQQKVKKKPATSAFFSINQLEIGASGGLSLNRFATAQPQAGFNTGLIASLSANYKFYKGLGLQLEANFLQQGGQLISFRDDTRYGLPQSFETKNVKNSSYLLNSIEIPLLVNYTFKIKQTWKPTFYTGGSFAHSFNVTENYQKTGDLLAGEDIIATAHGSQNVTGVFKSNRLNFIVGGNVKLPLYANLQLLLDFRYLAGITTVKDNYSYMDKAGFGTDVRSNSFISKIGIVLPLAKSKINN
ncbi:MAG: PorT family protein [Sphingobacteriaceae bacterium]|nr:MAG: PorT family protein [Sphingobacteriaceae bacterium]